MNFLIRNRSMIYLLSFLFITYTSIPATTHIDTVFEPYIRFIPNSMFALIDDSHLVVKLGIIKDKEVVAFCAKEYNLLGTLTRRLIVFDKDYWDGFSYTKRQLTLIHEFQHCLFDKKHDETLRLDGCPRSLMYPTVLSQACIDRHYEDYLLQLL